jgi:pseudaminic acid synthase
MKSEFAIGGRQIGPGRPVYIVAEMSANHGQDRCRAMEMIHAMKESGADAVKLQTYTPDTLTIDSDREYFRVGKGTPWEGRTLYRLYEEAMTPWDWHAELKTAAEDIGLDFFSTPFDETAVDFLEELGTPVHKIASFENVDHALIRRIAETGKPIIMSTGMATLPELEEAVETIRSAGGDQLALLKCTSAYPSPPEEMNLRTLPDLQQKFGVPVGLSDHTRGIAVPVAAVALGAQLLEKHFTLSREPEGPDSVFSLEPDEFREMAGAVRAAEKALGAPCYSPTETEMKSRCFRRSLFVVQAIRRGDEITPENVRSIRPGHGLHPRHLDTVLGKRAARDIDRGTPLAWDLVE